MILLRGLPGSGKSSLAALLSEDGKYPVLSIDDFFTNEKGEYDFKFNENHIAYNTCMEQTKKHLENGTKKVFVDNTFTLEWEMEPYFKMAADFNYYLFVITVENRHNKSNIHNITDDQIRKMAEKFKVVLCSGCSV